MTPQSKKSPIFRFQAWHISKDLDIESLEENRQLAKFIEQNVSPQLKRLITIGAVIPTKAYPSLAVSRSIRIRLKRVGHDWERNMKQLSKVELPAIIKRYFKTKLNKTLDFYNAFAEELAPEQIPEYGKVLVSGHLQMKVQEILAKSKGDAWCDLAAGMQDGKFNAAKFISERSKGYKKRAGRGLGYYTPRPMTPASASTISASPTPSPIDQQKVEVRTNTTLRIATRNLSQLHRRRSSSVSSVSSAGSLSPVELVESKSRVSLICGTPLQSPVQAHARSSFSFVYDTVMNQKPQATPALTLVCEASMNQGNTNVSVVCDASINEEQRGRATAALPSVAPIEEEPEDEEEVTLVPEVEEIDEPKVEDVTLVPEIEEIEEHKVKKVTFSAEPPYVHDAPETPIVQETSDYSFICDGTVADEVPEMIAPPEIEEEEPDMPGVFSAGSCLAYIMLPKSRIAMFFFQRPDDMIQFGVLSKTGKDIRLCIGSPITHAATNSPLQALRKDGTIALYFQRPLLYPDQRPMIAECKMIRKGDHISWEVRTLDLKMSAILQPRSDVGYKRMLFLESEYRPGEVVAASCSDDGGSWRVAHTPMSMPISAKSFSFTTSTAAGVGGATSDLFRIRSLNEKEVVQCEIDGIKSWPGLDDQEIHEAKIRIEKKPLNWHGLTPCAFPLSCGLIEGQRGSIAGVLCRTEDDGLQLYRGHPWWDELEKPELICKVKQGSNFLFIKDWGCILYLSTDGVMSRAQVTFNLKNRIRISEHAALRIGDALSMMLGDDLDLAN